MRHIDDEERRRRLVARHHLGRTAADVVSATRDLVALHSSDPTTPHLALWARVPGFGTDDLDDAIRHERSLWRLHAMRRTIWVVATEDASLVEGAAGRKIHAAERRRIEGWLAAASQDGAADVVDRVAEGVLAALADGPLSTRELGDRVDGFRQPVRLGSGRWAQEAPIGPRVLFLLAMELAIVRGANAGSFRSSQYEWARTEDWFGAVPERLDVREAQRELCARYLLRFGPVTSDDVRWWTGWPKTDTRGALADAAAVPVTLDGGLEGWLHPDDPGVATSDPAGSRVALLPSLDPTAMGWRDRGFYLDESLVPELFDRNGNVGPTIWVDGRIVGGWFVRSDASVDAVTLLDVDDEAAAAITAEVKALDARLDESVTPRFPTPLERRGRTGGEA